jgi:hypothetical protein
MAAQLVASRAVLSSIELVSYAPYCIVSHYLSAREFSTKNNMIASPHPPYKHELHPPAPLRLLCSPMDGTAILKQLRHLR